MLLGSNNKKIKEKVPLFYRVMAESWRDQWDFVLLSIGRNVYNKTCLWSVHHCSITEKNLLIFYFRCPSLLMLLSQFGVYLFLHAKVTSLVPKNNSSNLPFLELRHSYTIQIPIQLSVYQKQYLNKQVRAQYTFLSKFYFTCVYACVCVYNKCSALIRHVWQDDEISLLGRLKSATAHRQAMFTERACERVGIIYYKYAYICTCIYVSI